MSHQCAVGPADLGPYLLGQLSPAEASHVAALLADCPSCSAEVAALRPTVAAMAGTAAPELRPTVATGAAAPELRPPSLSVPSLDRMLNTVREQRQASSRTSRSVLAFAAALLVVALGVGGLVVALQRSGGETLRLDNASGASAQVVLEHRSWGTAMSIEVRGLDPGVTYGAWLARADGKRVPAGSFRSDANGSAKLELGAALSRADSSAMGVTALGGADILTTPLP